MSKSIITILSILIIVSCKQKEDNSSSFQLNNTESVLNINNEEHYPDDTYCADVKYYNPNTGTHSEYRLTIEVESNEVVTINFPNGGYLDTEHFSGAELDEDGTTSFTSDEGYEYEVQVINNSANCFVGVPMAIQCKGKTKSGNQCKHLTDNVNGLCWQHQNQE